MEDILYYPYAFDKYDNELVKKFLSEMKPERCRLIIMSNLDSDQCD